MTDGSIVLMRELEPVATSVRVARHMIDDLQDGIDAFLMADLRLTISEIVTNAVRHAPPGQIRVSVAVSHERIRIEVTDRGMRRFGPAARANDAESGRGLDLVDAVADRWGVEQRPSTVVWAELLRRR